MQCINLHLSPHVLFISSASVLSAYDPDGSTLHSRLCSAIPVVFVLCIAAVESLMDSCHRMALPISQSPCRICFVCNVILVPEFDPLLDNFMLTTYSAASCLLLDDSMSADGARRAWSRSPYTVLLTRALHQRGWSRVYLLSQICQVEIRNRKLPVLYLRFSVKLKAVARLRTGTLPTARRLLDDNASVWHPDLIPKWWSSH
jgi:hypothetical protein